MSRWSWDRPKDLIPADINKLDPLLVNLLTLCTPHGHEKFVKQVIARWVGCLKGSFKGTYETIEDNVVITINTPDGKPPETAFSCHIDIVGSVTKLNSDMGYTDYISLMTTNDKHAGEFLWGAKRYVDLKDKSKFSYVGCTLGADDKAGTWILLKLIELNVPGLYLFHVGEECGGVGSKALAEKHKGLFEGVKRAIAFDRADYSDVICTQNVGKCCSDEFGKALAEALNKSNYIPPKNKFKSGVRGTFTDTASYVRIIPECTNVSVGYFSQHGSNEKLDYLWLTGYLWPAIKEMVERGDFDNLPTVRDPSKIETYTSSYGSHYGSSWQEGKVWCRKTFKYVWPSELEEDTNSNVKKWSECNINTYLTDIPLWKPRDGWPQGCNDIAVLTKAIRRHLISNCTLMAEKDAVAEGYAIALAENILLKEELQVAKDLLIIMKGGKDGTKKETNSSKKDLKALPKPEPKTSEVGFKDNTEQKKNLVKGLLISATQLKSLEGISDIKLFKGYTLGATQFMAANDSKTKFSDKEHRKINKIIWNLAVALSQPKEGPDEFTEKLLEDVWVFICAHSQEKGFEGMSNPSPKGIWN